MWKHTHNGKCRGGDIVPLYRERHVEPGLDVFLLYERDADAPTWSMQPDTGAIKILAAVDGEGDGLVVEDARNP